MKEIKMRKECINLLQYHKFANIFPMIEGQEYEELKKDIQTQGLLQPIVTYENQILDGRNRYKACIDLDLKPIITNYKGDNPLGYVMSLNLKRRHLNESQRAIISLEVLPLLREETKKEQIKKISLYRKTGEKVAQIPLSKSREQAAQIFHVSPRYIQDAKKLQKENPEVIEEIRKGNKTISEVKTEIKIEKRKQNIKEQKEAIENGSIKLPEGKFEVIVIDPPWNYETEYNPQARRVSSPYPEMSLEDIKNINLPTTENCVLWLWTTHKFIWDAKKLLDEWGFEYKAMLIWDKQKLGIGSWLRMQCEFCLLGIKGKPLWNLSNQRDIISVMKKNHSRKPNEFYGMIDKLCIGRKLDYFAREKRKDWETYGIIENEVYDADNGVNT